jgi:hypothetical protein
VWTSNTRSPVLYPDAISLDPQTTVDEVLERVDRSPGCSIKDSFATLDAESHGFCTLFDAQWIVREPAQRLHPAQGMDWAVVNGTDEFVAWERAWRGQTGPVDVLRSSLLAVPSVTLLATFVGDEIVGGAILNRSSGVIGISNFFAPDDSISEMWQGFLAFTDTLFPAATLVGYESGGNLSAARKLGFVTAGPLQVWIK